MDFLLTTIPDSDKLILSTLLMSMEVHRHDKGAFCFWTHGEGKGTTFLMKPEDAKRLAEFLAAD